MKFLWEGICRLLSSRLRQHYIPNDSNLPSKLNDHHVSDLTAACPASVAFLLVKNLPSVMQYQGICIPQSYMINTDIMHTTNILLVLGLRLSQQC